MPKIRSVPTSRDDYTASLTSSTENAVLPDNRAVARPAALAQTLAKKKNINGVEYTSREVIYSRLPLRKKP
jgi:hypothetical protein